MKFNTILTLLTGSLLVVGSGCSTMNTQSEDEKTVFTQNEKFGDKLAKDICKQDPNAKILLASFVNANDLDMTDGFGRITTEQMAGRLVQRGLLVQEIRLRKVDGNPEVAISDAKSGEFSLSRDIKKLAGEHKADYVVTGVFTYGTYNTIVAIKAIDRDGMVISAYNYTVPATVSFDWDNHSLKKFNEHQTQAQKNIYWDPYEKMDNGERRDDQR